MYKALVKSKAVRKALEGKGGGAFSSLSAITTVGQDQEDDVTHCIWSTAQEAL